MSRSPSRDASSPSSAVSGASIAVQGRLLAELGSIWRLDRPALVGHEIGGVTVLRAHLLEGLVARGLVLVDAVVLRP